MRRRGFEHNSCHMVLTERRTGPVCSECMDHAEELFGAIIESIKELYRLSIERETQQNEDTQVK